MNRRKVGEMGGGRREAKRSAESAYLPMNTDNKILLESERIPTYIRETMRFCPGRASTWHRL